MSMPMLVIQGTFRAKGFRPDGDTIDFTPDDPADWKLVPGTRPVLPRSDGNAAIRMEGIDALETHYGDKTSPTGVQHQPLKLAHAAANELLTLLGFTDFHRVEPEPGDPPNPEAEKIISTIPEVTHGYVLARGADVFGRCVGLAGKGFPPAPNGYLIDIDERALKNTANYQLVKAGLAYPTYYSEFPELLRASLTAAAATARSAGTGVWAKDVTLTGAKVSGLDSLTTDDGAVILPKLFRRLKDYLDLNRPDPSLSCFRAYLAGASEDRFYLQGKPELFSGLHHIVEVTDGAGPHSVKMTHAAEEIVFVEK
ncbi:nuclease [Streptomyces sp. NPDC029216]|uniref:nuclease n=1 Tax=Streptomyces sp. NPDC029216 TaxID=3154701 RepID=UPI0033C7AB65